jgi:hypothetical protein
MNQLYHWQGFVVPLHCAFFPCLQSCWVTTISLCLLQVSPISRCHLMATMNQLNLDTEGPGIIALQSFLNLQSCRVTTTVISFYRISLTNLPLLLPSISLTNLPLQCKLPLTYKGNVQLQYAICTLLCVPSYNHNL